MIETHFDKNALNIRPPLPDLFYVYVGNVGDFLKICWMLLLGFAVNGPYALITTAVSADLGQHESLRNDAALMVSLLEL